MIHRYSIEKSSLPPAGFSLIETVAAIGIIGIIATITIPLFARYGSRSDLAQAREQVVSALRQAQRQTLSSRSQGKWGIYLATSTIPHQIITFWGTSFASRDASFDTRTVLPKSVLIAAVNPAEMQEIVFERLTGAASSTAVIRLERNNDSSVFTQIYLNKTGLASPMPFTQPDESSRVADTRHVHITYTRVIATSSESLAVSFNGGSVIQNIPFAENISDGQFNWEEEVLVDGHPQTLKIKTIRFNDPDTVFCFWRDRRQNDVAAEIDISGDWTATPNLISLSADGHSAATGSSMFATQLVWQ